jgi:hypothetical protein
VVCVPTALTIKSGVVASNANATASLLRIESRGKSLLRLRITSSLTRDRSQVCQEKGYKRVGKDLTKEDFLRFWTGGRSFWPD